MTIPLWHGSAALPPNSEFAREIYKLIRPVIPNQVWPVGEPVVGLFTPLADGMALTAELEHLPTTYKRLAEQIIAAKGVGLLKQSPAAHAANQMFRTKRWRDICLFALLPLAFLIPVVDGLFPQAEHGATLLAGLDLLGLIASQLRLLRAQDTLVESRFIVHIPSPSMKIRLNATNP